MLKNFLQHHKKLSDIDICDLTTQQNGENNGVVPPNIASNLITVVTTGNAALLDELLKAKLSPDITDSKGKTPMHIAASRGYEDCVLVLLKHGCNSHIRDVNGNTALWEAISSKHYAIFRILYHFAAISDPHIAGDLLCEAVKQNNVEVMKDLLKEGFNVDTEDHHGYTALQIAMAENQMDMVNLLAMNGADVVGLNTDDEFTPLEKLRVVEEEERGRVSIYRGHPLERRERNCNEVGKLILLPPSLDDLKKIAGEKFGFDGSETIVTNEDGAEIDSIEVIRDNDKLYFVENKII